MENALIFKQILLTNSLRKYMETCLENFYLDIGTWRVNRHMKWVDELKWIINRLVDVIKADGHMTVLINV